MIRLAALDIAGTTVQEHSAVYTALREALVAAGASPTETDIGEWMGAGKREAITALLRGDQGASPDAALDTALVERTVADFRGRLAAAYRATPPTPLPGVEEALARLRAAGIHVALTTGFDRDVTSDLLDGLGWSSGVLDAVVCVDDVTAGRPEPYMIFRAMEATGVGDVAQVLVAGDTPRDLQAGTRAGAAMVVGVLTGSTGAAALAREPHTHLLDSVADLPGLLHLGQVAA